jgi:glutamate-1-semialdehyde 2,1-aminomutase
LYGVKADLITFGKVIGGGLPVGAFAGGQEIMNHLAPLGPVYQAGTLSGNPLAMAAGLAMLKELNRKSEVYESLKKKTEYLEHGLKTVFAENKIKHTVNRVGSMISIHFSETAVVNFKTAALGDNDNFKKFFHGLLRRGVYIAPSAYESWFLCDALSYEDLDVTINACAEVAKTMS